MTRGLGRAQFGITQALIETFGDAIFELSHNLQLRRGDPVREKDFAAIEAQRAGLGLSDGEIATRIGLEVDQVTYIRNLIEHRRFHTGHYHRLNELGGGRRFRAERYTPHDERFAYSPDASRLRAAMSYPPDLARRYVESGWWTSDTLDGWLAPSGSTRWGATTFPGIW